MVIQGLGGDPYSGSSIAGSFENQGLGQLGINPRLLTGKTNLLDLYKILLSQKPIYGAEIAAHPAYDPAQSVMRPPPGTVGPTFGEAGALSELYKNLPLSELISSKAGPQMWSPYQRLLGPPGTMERMTAGTMFPTEETRTFEQYLPKFLELMEITKKPRKAKEAVRAPEIKEEEPEETPSEVHKMVPMAKMLMDEMRRIYGTLEEEKIPEVKTFKYGEGLRRGEEVLREPTKGEEKPRTGILGEFDEYMKVPGNENKTWMDFYSWRSATSKAQSKKMTLEEASKEYRQWLSLRKSIDDPTMVEAMLKAFGRDIPAAGKPKDEQIEALKRMIDDEIDYWRSVVESKKKRPGGRPDALGLRREIEAIRSGQ